jgi:hypothetical protein
LWNEVLVNYLYPLKLATSWHSLGICTISHQNTVILWLLYNFCPHRFCFFLQLILFSIIIRYIHAYLFIVKMFYLYPWRQSLTLLYSLLNFRFFLGLQPVRVHERKYITDFIEVDCIVLPWLNIYGRLNFVMLNLFWLLFLNPYFFLFTELNCFFKLPLLVTDILVNFSILKYQLIFFSIFYRYVVRRVSWVIIWRLISLSFWIFLYISFFTVFLGDFISSNN